MRKLTYLIMGITILLGCADESGSFNDIDNGTVGIGGSTARFTIHGDFLYIVNNTDLKVVDIADADDPVYKSTTDIGSGIETIYGYKNNLFIGSMFGMQIYTIDNSGTPVFMSDYRHQTACDPVIANDQYAYVTIRSGLECSNQLFEANRLITIDITDLRNPYDVDQIQMINPRGLAFFKEDLYVAEGQNGLKRFSLADPAHPTLVQFYDTIPANDMIALESTMIITRDTGIYQFGCVNDDLQYFSPIQ